MAQKKTIELARELRRNSTEEEKILWKYLRSRKFLNLKFNRQHPIVYGGNNLREDFFVADFYCHEKKLIVELDGEIHMTQKAYDKGRNSILNELNIHVLRIENSMLKSPYAVLDLIENYINKNHL